MDLREVDDKAIIAEVERRFEEKNASMKEMEFLTKKLLELNEKAQESEKVKTEFLSLIKNEFNNPLSSLLNLANSLANNLHQDRMDEIARLINMEIRKLDFYFKNIFAATEIEAGEIGNYYSAINFENIVGDVLYTFKYLIEDKNLQIEFIDNCKSKIISDSEKIYLILLNLISNACEHSYPNSKILFTLDCDEKYFFIEVKDFGEGIGVHFKKEVFNRFAKYSSGKTRAQVGLGLGLSVALGESEALEGAIDFQSEEGETIFTVKIPKVNEELITIDSSESSNELFFDNFDEGEFEEKEF